MTYGTILWTNNHMNIVAAVLKSILMFIRPECMTLSTTQHYIFKLLRNLRTRYLQHETLRLHGLSGRDRRMTTLPPALNNTGVKDRVAFQAGLCVLADWPTNTQCRLR